MYLFLWLEKGEGKRRTRHKSDSAWGQVKGVGKKAGWRAAIHDNRG